MWPHDIIWRSGPELSLSVPLSTKQGKKLMIRDSWIRLISAVHPLQSWIEESFLLIHPFILTQTIGRVHILLYLHLLVCSQKLF